MSSEFYRVINLSIALLARVLMNATETYLIGSQICERHTRTVVDTAVIL